MGGGGARSEELRIEGAEDCRRANSEMRMAQGYHLTGTAGTCIYIKRLVVLVSKVPFAHEMDDCPTYTHMSIQL